MPSFPGYLQCGTTNNGYAANSPFAVAPILLFGTLATINQGACPTAVPSDQQQPQSISSFRRATAAVENYFFLLTEAAKAELPWNSRAYLALASLVAIWALRMYTTWATWGSLSIDSGHEAYIPAVLAQGKMLYRDVWWMYTPLAPYINSSLFRWFGIRLEVLYWAGSLAALGSAVFVFLAGRRLSSTLMGWTAGTVILLQAFQSWHFCFPFPYTFAAVYGCLTACAFLWCAINSLLAKKWVWSFAAATLSAIALLMKPEIGVACYLAFLAAVAMAAVLRRSWRAIVFNLFLAVPGILLCGVAIHWMISIAGTSFITQENIMSWPTSYFMKVYGKVWLDQTGFSLAPRAFGLAFLRSIYFFGFFFTALSFAAQKKSSYVSILGRILFLAFLVAAAAYLGWPLANMLRGIFFPRDMVLHVSVLAALAAWFFLRHPSRQSAAVATVAIFSSILAARLLLKMTPGGYPIYYNGPVLLVFLIALCPFFRIGDAAQSVVDRAKLLLSVGCLGTVAWVSLAFVADRAQLAELKSGRGSIFVPPDVAANYEAAIQFIKEANHRGELVLSVPDDPGLYFFSGQDCPTRIFQFTPGIVAPGKMTADVLNQIEEKPVRFLIWSSRTYSEYGAPVFGKDFNQDLGEYLASRYHPVGAFVPHSDPRSQANFTLWERNSESAAQPGDKKAH
jgi:hypothetical protein